MSNVTFKPSNVHQGHYVYINGESTGIFVNLFAYQTIDEYKTQKDKQIEEYENTIS
jgi:hypothetical protein